MTCCLRVTADDLNFLYRNLRNTRAIDNGSCNLEPWSSNREKKTRADTPFPNVHIMPMEGSWDGGGSFLTPRLPTHSQVSIQAVRVHSHRFRGGIR
ncbi:hypothetical protein TNCV_1611791 [Trichonephila clavipes]|nr:hypothetical protein TNCV_1611791 [Trichonephila clavipes]